MSRTNMRSNVPWGDDLQEKQQNHTRIYVANLNGLPLDSRGGKFEDLCNTIKETGADVFCGQEHNLDTCQFAVKKILYDTTNQHWQRSKLILGSSPVIFSSWYKPGGTLMVTVNHLTGRISNQASDKWGRWTVQEFLGKEGRRIAIFSCYQVVRQSCSQGKTTAASQQHSLLLQTNDSVTDPRTAFIRDLLAALQEKINNGAELLIVGDFNEAFGADEQGISSIANKLNLQYLMSVRNMSQPPSTYARGQKCLDFALSTNHVARALTQAGYEAFNERLHTDHRPYFMDFNNDLLFGTNTPTLSSKIPRLLSSKNQVQVTQYLRIKHKILEDHNVFKRADKLQWLGNRHGYAERLDKDIKEASLAAENALRRFAEPAWSLELASARIEVTCLSKQLSAIKTGIPVSANLQTYVERNQIALPTTKRDCSNALRVAKLRVKEIVKDSYQRRDAERERRINELNQSGQAADRKQANVLRSLKKTEDIKEVFRKLKYARGGYERRGITRIEIPVHPDDDPKSCSEWKQLDIPDEIFDNLLRRNRSHFGQAHGSPFTINPLRDDLGFSGSAQGGEAILEGKYNTENLQQSVQILIQHLRQTKEMMEHQENPTITDDELVSKLKVWSESTTTSPSGMHLGHYKALIARHAYSTNAPTETLTEAQRANRDELNKIQTDIREVHLKLINYALERGYSYQRWRNVANSILFKDRDNVKIHRTRVIHIYEADLNLSLGIKWRAAMHRAEDLKLLNEGQYGSRPYRSAVDPVFLEELQYEVARATRKSLILTNYDAMACYDRIIPSVAMISSRKYGVPASVTQMNAHMLEKAKYRIRTETGLAEAGYQHSEEHPIYGTGQGSSNSPSIWSFISSSLFDGYDEATSGAQYVDPQNLEKIQLGMIGFVDDCNGQVNKFQEPRRSALDVRSLVEKAETNAQQWTALLEASGGALELSKCSSHVVSWQFTASGEPVIAPRNRNQPYKIKVFDSSGKQHEIGELSPYSAHKTLGHYKEPAGNQREQRKKLRELCSSNTKFLWNCPLTRREAWTYYFACFIPSVCYPLSCSHFSKRQLEDIQRQSMSIIIARCGYNRNTKREIIYGPLELGGANFRHLYHQQGIRQTILFLKHWRSKSQAGALLRIAVRWFHQAVGVSFSIFENTSKQLPHLESKWLASVREFLATVPASLELDEPGTPKLQRLHDFHIMEAIMDSQQFSNKEVQRLNYCRLYLQAVTISDITNSKGTIIDRPYIEGRLPIIRRSIRGPWIHQDRPGDNEWKLWKKAMKVWSYDSGTLYQPLGCWVLPIHEQQMIHMAYKTREKIYIKQHDDTYVIQEQEQTTEGPIWARTVGQVVWEHIPTIAVPIDVQYSGGNRWLIQSTSKIQKPIHRRYPATFEEYIMSLDPWESELLQYTELQADPFTVRESLIQGIRVVSDGSEWYKTHGAFGWAMSNELGERVAVGMGPARGSVASAFRSEAYGMLAVLRFLVRLAEFTGQELDSNAWCGVLATDCERLLNRLASFRKQAKDRNPTHIHISSKRVDVMEHDWDIVIELQHNLRAFSQLELQHVKGHQDRMTQYLQLPLLAQLNVDADNQAKKYQVLHGASRPLVFMFPHTRVQLLVDRGTITAHHENVLRFQVTSKPLRDHITARNNWDERTARTINWKVHGSVLKQRINRRIHYTKLVHDILPVNATLHRRDQTRQVCPNCKIQKETRDHILRCSGEDRKTWRQTLSSDLEKACRSMQTRPDLRILLLRALKEWLQDDSDSFELDPAQEYNGEVQRIIRQQQAIGWRQLFNGRFSKEWSHLQDDYYRSMDESSRNKRMTGDRWQAAIIGVIWDKWYILWEMRNMDLHGADQAGRTAAARVEVHRTLREIYTQREHLEPRVQHLLREAETEHRDEPLRVTQNWLAIHGQLLQDSLRRVKERTRRGMRNIQSYFSTVQ